MIFAAAALCRADGFDYSSLFNPQNLRQLNTTYRTPDGRPVFDISTESMSIDSRRKLWGVSVPLVAIKNLRLSVHAQNLADAEISKIYTPRPFDISASPLTLKIFGKKSVLTITASEATVEPDNILRLSDDAQMSVGEKRVALGKGATLRINGRVLYISSAGAGNLGVRL